MTMPELPPLKLPALPSLPARSMADHERYIIELREVMRCRERVLMARIAVNDNALSWIGELLAVMHADGGHYLFKHGMEKAIGDAVDKYYAMCMRIEELEAERDSWKTGNIHSCHDACPRIECVQRRRIAELEAKVRDV